MKAEFTNGRFASDHAGKRQKSVDSRGIRTVRNFRTVAACAALALAGCAKERIVSVPCIQISDLPPETVKPHLTGNAGVDLAIMTDTALQLLDEVVKLRALASGCVG